MPTYIRKETMFLYKMLELLIFCCKILSKFALFENNSEPMKSSSYMIVSIMFI